MSEPTEEQKRIEADELALIEERAKVAKLNEDKLLKTKLNILVNSQVPGNSIIIDSGEANYILTIMSEYQELQKYCQNLEDEIIDIQATTNNTSKR